MRDSHGIGELKMEFLPILPAVILGAMSQRVTGMGFALIAAPFVLLLYGPITAVIVVNLCGIVAATVIWFRTGQHIDWRRLRWLLFPALAAIIPGTLFVIVPPRAVVETAVGVMLIAALTLALTVHRGGRVYDGAALRLTAGFASGLMNSAAGAGGPPLTAYAVLSGWEQRSFAATCQPYLIAVAGASILSKVVLEPSTWPQFPVWLWLLIVACLFAGLYAGDRISRYVGGTLARTLVIIIAFGGAIAALIKGVTSLLS